MSLSSDDELDLAGVERFFAQPARPNAIVQIAFTAHEMRERAEQLNTTQELKGVPQDALKPVAGELADELGLWGS